MERAENMIDVGRLAGLQPTIAILCLAAAGLIVVLLWRSPTLRGNVASEGGRLWVALRPDFRIFAFERWTTQTLHLLFSAIIAFAVVSLLWAASAGALRATWLLSTPNLSSSGGSLSPKGAIGSIGSFGFILVEIVRAVGGVLLCAAAAGMAGSLIGFVFGVPRPVSDPVPAGAVDPPASRRAADARRRAWKLSTNLTDVSDWLTKIIVGVGLVEAQSGIGKFARLTSYIASFLFNRRHGSEILIGAVMVGSAVFGFLFAYLFAQLIVSRLMEFADSQIGDAAPESVKALTGMKAIAESIVPRIGRSNSTQEPAPIPDPEQLRAALLYSSVSYEELVSGAEPTTKQVLSWARAKALLNDYPAAARGYVYLLGMKPE